MLTKRGVPRTTSIKKPRIRSLADIPTLAFDDAVGGDQGSNDSGSSTPPDTDVDDPVCVDDGVHMRMLCVGCCWMLVLCCCFVYNLKNSDHLPAALPCKTAHTPSLPFLPSPQNPVTWGRKRGRGARRPASTFEDVMAGDTTTLKPLPPSLFNLTSPPRTLGTCEDFRSPPYDKSAARIPQFLHHTVQPKSNKRKSATVGYTAVLASQYGAASGDKRVNRDLYLDEMAALDTGAGLHDKENTPMVARKMVAQHHNGGGRHEAERDAVDALCTLSNNAQHV